MDRSRKLVPSPTIFVINLDRSQDRLSTFMKSFGADFSIHRIQAYDGKMLTKYDDIFIPPYTHSGEIPEIACSYSHIKAVQTAYRMGLQGALIMEDDSMDNVHHFWPSYTEENKVHKNFHIRNIIANCPKNTELLSLATVNTSHWNTLLKCEVGYKSLDQNCWGASCYYITRLGMEKVVNNYCTQDSKMNLNKRTKKVRRYRSDNEIIYGILSNKYIYTRPIFHVDAKDSLIHPHHVPIFARSKTFLQTKIQPRKDTCIRSKSKEESTVQYSANDKSLHTEHDVSFFM